MKIRKKIGIWMDHSTANMIDFSIKKKKYAIDSNFTSNTQEEALNKSENLMHNKRQQMHEAYYKRIADKILDFDHVLLFGPTDAKKEFYNYLNKDMHFKDIKIDIETADNMTENQMNSFVRDYFEVPSI